MSTGPTAPEGGGRISGAHRGSFRLGGQNAAAAGAGTRPPEGRGGGWNGAGGASRQPPRLPSWQGLALPSSLCGAGGCRSLFLWGRGDVMYLAIVGRKSYWLFFLPRLSRWEGNLYCSKSKTVMCDPQGEFGFIVWAFFLPLTIELQEFSCRSDSLCEIEIAAICLPVPLSPSVLWQCTEK